VGDALPYIAILMVGVGWLVANSQANSREDRKEARALIDGARTRVGQIVDDSVRYFCDDRTELAVTIKASLEVLEIDLSRLPHFASKSSPLLARLVAFQDAVTGGAFETLDQARLSLQSDEIRIVYQTRNELLTELERQYRVHYLGRGSTPG
jgi:hypothetical protein